MADGSLAFHHWVDPAGRSGPSGHQKIVAGPDERAAIATWLDIPGLNTLEASLRIRRTGAGEAEVSGTIIADAELICSVSLDSFSQHFEIPVQAVFRRPPAKGDDLNGDDVEFGLDGDEPREWGLHGVDLGALIAEELSLALPDFPRKPGAELSQDSAAEIDTGRINPFAVLKKLQGPD